MSRFEKERNFLKSNFSEFKSIKTDRMKGMPEPEKIKSYDLNGKIIDLPPVNSSVVKKKDIYECIKDRRSTRFYSEEQVGLEELIGLKVDFNIKEGYYDNSSRNITNNRFKSHMRSTGRRAK